jgi:hypothetical protein
VSDEDQRLTDDLLSSAETPERQDGRREKEPPAMSTPQFDGLSKLKVNSRSIPRRNNAPHLLRSLFATVT